MAYVLALIPVGFGVLKMYTNYTSENNKDLQADNVRKMGVIQKLITGPNPPVMYMSDKELERMIKTNSACRKHEIIIREVRAKHLQKSADVEG